MEGVLNIMQSACYSNYLEVYLSAIQDHQSFRSKVPDEVIQHITSILNKPHMYREAFLLLNCYLKQASLEVLKQKFNIWITLTLKAFNSINFENIAVLVYSTLSSLVLNSLLVPEISKSFAHNHLPKVYESLIKVSTSESLAVLQCAESCLRLYPGQSGLFRNSLEAFLYRYIDTSDVTLNIWCGKCLLLLQQVRGGEIHGFSQKSSWFNYQEKLINSLHNILNITFSNCTDFYELTCENWNIQELKLNNDPVERLGQLFIRFRNIVNFLIIALRNSFPVPKPIATKKIIHLIARGLSVTCPILSQNPTADHLALGLLIPKMHILLLDLLKALILSLKTNLKTHHCTILRFIVDTLQWTSLKNVAGPTKSYFALRCKTYEILSLWCVTMKTGSRVELVIHELVEEIFNDVTPFQLELTLKVLSGSNRHMSKKARHQIYKTQNHQSNLSQYYVNDNAMMKQNFSDEQSIQLCVSALQSLQKILISAANFLKPNCLKLLQIKILHLCGAIYALQIQRQELYYNWQCRLEMYKMLYVFIIQSQQLCPPPTQVAFNILQTAQLCDRNATVRIQCQELLINLEKIIHPNKENLLFPANIRDIRKTFSNYGKNQFLRSISTSTYWDVEMQDTLTESIFENSYRTNEGNDTFIKLKHIANEQNSSNLPPIDLDTSITMKNMSSPILDEFNNSKSIEPSISHSCLTGDNTDGRNTEHEIIGILSTGPSQKIPKFSSNTDTIEKQTISKEIDFSKNIAIDYSKTEIDDNAFAEIEKAFVDELN